MIGHFRKLLFIFLVIYSLTLLFIEGQTSQDFVRHFFTDIQGPVPFYAVNTSLSVFLLWSTALIFAVCLLCLEPHSNPYKKGFYWSQIIFFIVLGFDDRFLVHEALSHWFSEAYFMLGLSLIEIGFLIQLGQLEQRPKLVLYYLFAGAFFTGLMIFIDKFLPSRMIFRLSLEDLSKLWGTMCFFFFAWEILKHDIQQFKDKNA